MPLKERLEQSDLLPSAEEMAEFDQHTISTSGVSGLELMERAGEACARIISSLFRERKILILCGPGNNGGDGYVVARHLVENGRKVDVIQAPSEKYSDELLHNKSRYTGNLFESETCELSALRVNQEPLIIVDALLGTGQSSAPRKNIARVLQQVRSLHVKDDHIVAIDVPSAMNPTTGAVYDDILPVDRTLTFEFLKRGLTQAPALDACGKIEVLPIGIIASRTTEFLALNLNTVPVPPKRPHGAHKGTFGHTVVIGGCGKMPGAPVLTAMAALHSGCGKVTVVSPTERSIELSNLPEAMWVIPQSEGEILQSKHFSEMKDLLQGASAIAIGPGMGRDDETAEFIKMVISFSHAANIKIVVDADALWPELLSDLDPANSIITPHPGEAARLLGCETTTISSDRFEALKNLYSRFRCVCLLKGAGSLLGGPSGFYVNTSGTSHMATAGSGDVLTGAVVSLLSQGASPEEALLCAVYMHGLAGEIASQEHGGGILASDIARAIPSAMRVIRER